MRINAQSLNSTVPSPPPNPNSPTVPYRLSSGCSSSPLCQTLPYCHPPSLSRLNTEIKDSEKCPCSSPTLSTARCRPSAYPPCGAGQQKGKTEPQSPRYKTWCVCLWVWPAWHFHPPSVVTDLLPHGGVICGPLAQSHYSVTSIVIGQACACDWKWTNQSVSLEFFSI